MRAEARDVAAVAEQVSLQRVAAVGVLIVQLQPTVLREAGPHIKSGPRDITPVLTPPPPHASFKRVLFRTF